jgi:hypothetical protein
MAQFVGEWRAVLNTDMNIVEFTYSLSGYYMTLNVSRTGMVMVTPAVATCSSLRAGGRNHIFRLRIRSATLVVFCTSTETYIL